MRRSEDRRILTGRGTYVDDVKLPGMLHAAFLRSPLPHALIRRIDVTAAREAPGVVGVFSGEEMEAMLQPGHYGIGVSPRVSIASTPNSDAPKPVFSCIATDKVRLVGDLVALVVAESRYLAEDATELIDVEYDELPPVTTPEQALDPSIPPIFDDLGSNILFVPTARVYGDVDGAFERADRVLRTRIIQHRHQNVPIETRGCIASYDARADRLVVWSANQGVHHHRMIIANRLGMLPEQVRIRTADVGGSFGLKIGASREDVAVAAASRALGRPVKYIEDRSEDLMASGHARDESFDVEAAYTNDGDILALKVKMVIDTGSYPGRGGRLPLAIEGMLPGASKIVGLQFEATAVVTNKATYVAYRGPWAAETFVRERVFDLVARELGLEPLTVRKRNYIRSEDQPRSMVTGRTLAGVTVAESLDKIETLIDLPAFRHRQEQARADGRFLGIGVASYIEPAPGPRTGDTPIANEQMMMRLEIDGTVTVITGQMPHGQGHETTIAQVAADHFGVEFESVRVVFGDSDIVPRGLTGGSRSATMAGGAAMMAARALNQKVRDAAANLLEASPEDLRIERGSVAVLGVPASAVPLTDVAAAAAKDGRSRGSSEAQLEVDVNYDGGVGGWSGGSHCAIVEVDIETGIVSFERYLVAEDCGELINPAVVDGQIRGGVAQGIGAVLLERSAYDDEGNCLTSTFMDYLLPTTMDIPRIEIFHLESVPLDPDVNFRGVGEGGMIVAPAAVCNAIEDALATLGVRIHEQHLPPARLLELAGVIKAE